MRAIIQNAYGAPSVLHLTELSKPVPKDHEVLVKLAATTVTSGDARMRAFDVPAMFWLPGRLFMGITRPRKNVLGAEFAGTIEAVGKAVTKFRTGDAVFGLHVYDCYADYKTVPETAAIALKPAGMSFDEAAALPFGALTALHFLLAGKIKAGDQVLINGASGAVGTAAVQLAKYFGATVTGVCSTANVDLVKSLGADAVIDYASADFTTGGARYDIIFDTVGKTSFARCRAIMQPDARYLAAVMSPGAIGWALWTSLSGRRKLIGGISVPRQENLQLLAGLVEAGRLWPVIDRHYDLDEIVAAHAHVDTGHKRGAVVVRL
ncbi:NAD(P)-dependent alcohol dehydrogenase [Devosia sp.]|uniref:NAD(P)-dependent alcohol dehydrogenase n=1 Tax=Devosia sp. TaxID=1871048 RepID=UPI003267EE57